jgi:MFS family permease
VSDRSGAALTRKAGNVAHGDPANRSARRLDIDNGAEVALGFVDSRGVRRTSPMIEAPMIASMLRRLLARLSRSGEPGPAGAASAGMFRSLSNRNYRLWAAGAFVSNVGTWMQRTAQDWLVLAELTPHNATAVGIVMALQFGPSLALLPLTGWLADHVDRRKLLMVTQGAMGTLALALGLLTVFGVAQLWHVYVFALLLGCITAFDAPARQAFVTDLVGRRDLVNAVALNSMSFQAARMIGPAVAGVLIASFGTGWSFLCNALSFAAVLAALARLRVGELHRTPMQAHERGSMVDGLRYVWHRDDLKTVLAMLFLVATFGLNFPIFISTMAVSVFRVQANAYGLLSSMLAMGAVLGALLSARRAGPRMPLLVGGAAVFGAGCAIAAVMPGYAYFAAALVVIGFASQTFMIGANSTVQIASDPGLRGRVMAIYLAIALGSTPLGAPIVGWVADAFGPRWALAVAAAAGIAAAFVGWRYVARSRPTG